MTGVSGSSASSNAAAHAANPQSTRRPAASEPRDLSAGSVVIPASSVDDLRGLADHDVLERIAAYECQIAALSARQLAAIAELARRPARIESVGEDPAAARAADAPLGRCVRDPLPDELSARLRTSTQAASARVGLACGLVRLPVTRAALHTGAIDVARARVMVDEVAALDAVAAREVEVALAPLTERLTPARLRARVRREVLAIDPVAAHVRAERARCDRRVVITPVADGMAELWALLPAVEAVAIRTAITAAAREAKRTADPSDHRSMDARRADALAAPFVHALESGELAGGQLARGRGGRTELWVTIAASTLAGLEEQPAELSGYGPITAATARELAPDARWRRIVTDPLSGAVLDVGSTTYAPPPQITRHVIARDPHCTFPGCGQPALACDLDHVVPFPEGPTAVDNLHPLCRRHHRLKQHPAVTIERDDEGTVHWRLPTGHVYDTPSDPIASSMPPPVVDPTGDAASSTEPDAPDPPPL